MQAAKLGYSALALTDECSLSGVVKAHLAAQQHGLKLIVGSEIRLLEGMRLVVLACDQQGYSQLTTLITAARCNAAKGHYRLSRAMLADGLGACLVLLLPGSEAEHEARWVAETFSGRAWLAVELLRGPDDHARYSELRCVGRRCGLPLVAAGDVHMHVRSRRAVQDILTAIRLGRSVDTLGDALYANGERHLRRRSDLACVYPPDLLQETLRVAERCSFSLDDLHYEYPDEFVPGGATPSAYLRALTEAGMRKRWPQGAPGKVASQVDRELKLIEELHYEAYFLTVHDIVDFARKRGILCQGRGSAANSAVCFYLGITAVDPARMDMLFERFISRERNEPPDIDVDFEHERREEVIQYIYRKYGRDRAALASSVVTYRMPSAIRDVGKALGIPHNHIERIARNVDHWEHKQALGEYMKASGRAQFNPLVQRLVWLVETLVGFPRHLSQHVGGFVIARQPLSSLVPVENAAMPERTVIQWDKDDLDALGLLKVDVLSLGMLSALRRALGLLEQLTERTYSVAEIPAEDSAVYEMMQRADTMGVFQIESRAQMAMLPRLKPRCFYDLVIQVAIVRPGPIQGNMVHPYLRRRQGLEPAVYPDDAVREVLQRTLGVPIFQEQVIKLAMVAAGFSAGEADYLRRSMAAWRRKGKLDAFEDRLIKGMRQRGYPEQFAREIFSQIQGFGEYGFPESHAASFAMLAYVSAWLKCHEPAVFLCALLNSQPLGFYQPAQLIQDARRHGVEVRAVDVVHSDWDSTIESCDGGRVHVRLGMRVVKGLQRAVAELLVAARQRHGLRDAADLVRCAGLHRHELMPLVAAGALSGLVGHRHQAYWWAMGIQASLPLFDSPVPTSKPVMLSSPDMQQDVLADYAAMGLSLGPHPLSFLRKQLPPMKRAEELMTLADRTHVSMAGLVVCRQRPCTASGVVFLTLEDETGIFNIIVWRQEMKRYRRIVMGSRLMGVHGHVQREGRVLHIIAERLEDYSPRLAGLATASRDFC